MVTSSAVSFTKGFERKKKAVSFKTRLTAYFKTRVPISTLTQKTRSQQPCQNPANHSWATEDNESNSPTKINTDRGQWIQTLNQVSETEEATTSTVQGRVDENDHKNELNSATTGDQAEELDRLDETMTISREMIEAATEADSVAIEVDTVTTESHGKPGLLDGDLLLVRWPKGRV